MLLARLPCAQSIMVRCPCASIRRRESDREERTVGLQNYRYQYRCLSRVCPGSPGVFEPVRGETSRGRAMSLVGPVPWLLRPGPRLPPVRFLNHTVHCYRRARLLHYSLAVAYTTPQFNEYWASASSLTSQEDAMQHPPRAWTHW